MILPYEEETRVQDILGSDTTIERKSYRLLAYYKSKIPYNRNRMGKQDRTALSFHQIRMELEKRGDNLTPIEIEL